MTAYYPSQAGYAATQPVVTYPSVAGGYGQYGMAGSYAQPGGVMYVPPSNSGFGHRHSHHRYNDYDYNDYDYRVPQVATTVAAPAMMMQQPTYAATYHPHHHSFGARFRRFFGLAPSTGVKYKSDHGTWGFMGFSRRQRYIDPRTGGEVDRKGRPVYRI